MPAGFANYASEGDWICPAHLQALNLKLLDVVAGRCPRLIISMPPQHGKSEFTSKYFPAWFLGKFPKKKVILASYEASYAQTWGKAAREVFMNHAPTVFGVNVDPSLRSGTYWRTKKGGYMWAVGVGGGITGKGAHVFLIDDPIKNDTEALSPTYRQKTWNWFQATAMTRIQPGGAMIVIMTRWHDDDLAGRLIQKSKAGEIDPWEVIDFPALAKPGDILGRKEGEALWPWRYDEKHLNSVRKTVGTFWWNALYQQSPVADEGGVFEYGWWQYFNEQSAPRHTYRVQSWDTAYEAHDSANWSVCGTWDENDKGYYLRDKYRKRLEYPDLKRAVLTQYRKWRPDAVLIEYMASGKSIVQDLRRDRRIKVPILAKQVTRASKETRARAVSATVESGLVSLPEGAPWVEPFLDELCRFPGAKHDDRVDMTSQALEHLNKRGHKVGSGAKILGG